MFEFDRGLAPGELRGTVVFRTVAGAQLPAANATVVLEGSPLSVTADSQGVFALEGLPAGSYTIDISASSSGSGPADLGLHLANIAIGAQQGVDLGQITLGRLGALQGTVTLEGVPVAAATAVIPGLTQAPVTNGSYRLDVLRPGTYRLSVFLVDNPGAIESGLINVQVNPGQTTQVPLISLTQAELQLTGAVQGVVLLSGLASSAGIDVQFSGRGPDLTTGAQGQYSGSGIPAGIYSVTASIGGFQSVTVSNIVVGGPATLVPTITLFAGTFPTQDAGPSDAGPVFVDAGPSDAGPIFMDAGPSDAGPISMDAGPSDAGPMFLDAGPADAGPMFLDAGPADAGPMFLDAGPADAGPMFLDAGPADAGPMFLDAGPGFVDAGPPPVPDTSIADRLITYTRIPWGDSATGGVASFSVAGLANAASGCASVVIFDGPNPATANRLGTAAVDGTGAFTATLSATDHPTVYIAGLSTQGLLSAAVAVHVIQWTATFDNKVSGSTTANPHVLTTTGDYALAPLPAGFTGPLVPDALWARETTSYAGVTAPGDSQVLTENAITTDWNNITPGPVGRFGAAASFDSVGKNLVLFGGCPAGDGCASPLADTWYWGGQDWTNETAGFNASPPGRANAAMAYDAKTQTTVLFGGETGSGGSWTALDDTWTLQTDGFGWQNLTSTAGLPTASAGASMVYDSVREVILLVTPDGNDWTFNGSVWISVTPVNGTPPPRSFAGMTFDSLRGEAVLFGGCGMAGSGPNGCAGFLNDTWTWDGSFWTQAMPANNPTVRAGVGMTFDSARGVSVLTGGFDSRGDALVDTWEWNGTTWTQANADTGMTSRFLSPLVYDSVRNRSVVLGGCTAFEGDNDPCFTTVGDIWMWDGTNFTNLNLDGTDPGLTAGIPGVVYDSVRSVDVFFDQVTGSTTTNNEVFELNGADWEQVTPTGSSPVPRFSFAMVYDSTAEETTLFGGYVLSAGTNLADTWAWNAGTWTNLTPAGTSPTARRNHAMAFDSVRGVTVLFGGYEVSAVVGDTWEWNGLTSTWTAPTLTGSLPVARDQHVMTFDAAQGQTVLFGGTSNGTNANLTDTWQWNGTRWTSFSPASTPPARDDAAFVYDTSRGVDLLFGGQTSNSATAGYNDLWEWDGSNWTGVSTSGVAPPEGSWAGSAYDQSRSGLLLAGGGLGTLTYDQTWLLSSDVGRVPLAVAQFSFAAAGAVSPTITQMTFNVYAGGSGNTLVIPGRGVSVPGATLGVWSTANAWWSTTATNSSPPATPAQMLYTTGSAAEAQDYLYAPTQTINVAVIPSNGRGNGLAAPELAVDYAEVTVSYQQ